MTHPHPSPRRNPVARALRHLHRRLWRRRIADCIFGWFNAPPPYDPELDVVMRRIREAPPPTLAEAVHRGFPVLPE